MKHYDVPDIRAAYDAIRAKDPTRPIFIGFGKGLSLPRPQSNYFLQGYEPSEYCAVPDVTAADYYGPQDAQHGPDGQWVYGRTMDLMRASCGNAKPIWNFVDVEKVNAPDEPGGDLPAPTPLEIKQKVWLSIITTGPPESSTSATTSVTAASAPGIRSTSTTGRARGRSRRPTRCSRSTRRC